MKMRVLIACEFSGTVRDAFAACGHDAWSCDLLPSEKPGNHIQGDVLNILGGGWDLMIAHPPCTFLCNSGVRWLRERPDRWDQMREASWFFKRLLDAEVPRVAVENPIPHGHAKLPIRSQIFQPWQHGEPEVKATCLWLRNLPTLLPSNVVGGRNPRTHRASPGPDRWKERSRTLPGIAKAMAEQWGGIRGDGCGFGKEQV